MTHQSSAVQNTDTRHTRFMWGLILLLVVLLVGINSYLNRSTISELSELQSEIRKSSKIVGLLQQMHVQLLTVESGQRGFLLTEDTPYLQYYNKSIVQIDQVTKQLMSLESSDESQKALIKTLITLVDEKLAAMQETVNTVKEEDVSQAIEIVETDEGLKLYRQINALIQEIKQNETVISETQIAELEMVSKASERNFVISLITTLILVLGLFLLVKMNLKNQSERQREAEQQNQKLQDAVDERTTELSLYSEELSRSNRELEDFAFVASHDLQEPLRKIMAFGERLESQADAFSEKQLDYLKRMRSAAARMSKLISDLLAFSRVNTKGSEFQTIDLNVLVSECLEDLNVLVEETGVALEIAKLPSIQGDPTQIQQLFFNLIANAIKFSQSTGAPHVKLGVTSVSQPESVEVEGLSKWSCFEISDNGIGFEQEHPEKIFAPFQRLHSRSEYKGTGIGLAICRRIVERHNGTIEALGRPGKGATFKVCIPGDNQLNTIRSTST
jgi:signal transduction histidine kinase